jgi:hypothetical protein
VVPLVTEQLLLPTSWLVVVSVTVPPPKDPKVVPVGSVTVTALSAGPSRAPVAEAPKPMVHVAWAPAAVDEGETDNPVTALGVVMETEAVAALVSADVDTEVEVEPVALGLVTPLRATDSTSPGSTA